MMRHFQNALCAAEAARLDVDAGGVQLMGHLVQVLGKAFGAERKPGNPKAA